MSKRSVRMPPLAVEVLRLLVVVVCAEIGYWLVVAFDDASPGDAEPVLGPFDARFLGLLVGAGIGYVIGGVLARTTLTAVDRATDVLSGRSAEQVLAGAFGALLGLLAAAILSWPVFFLPTPALSLPIFAFVVITGGLLGHRLGLERRDGVLGLVGQRAGVAVAPQSTSAMPRIVDTSVAIDGRILDIVRAGFLHGRMLVPSAVLGELQAMADSSDETRRSRGRRGLDILESLRREQAVDVSILDVDVPEVPEVDGKLIRLCLDRKAALLTLDTNLARVASLAGVRVMNLHALALAMRPQVQAGDEISVLLTKEGSQAGQGVGFLDDGTMVVVERAASAIGEEHVVDVTSVLTTANGRMVFARLAGTEQQLRPVEQPATETPVPKPPRSRRTTA